MSTSRPAELAGRWYPSSGEACDRFLDAVELAPPSALPDDLAGAIVPHAGWVYSGAIAYRALAPLARARPDTTLVVVFGGHLGARDRPRLMIEGAWDTPYGALPVAEELAQDVGMALECEHETPDDFFDDNAVEVVLPMVKKLWPSARVLTLGVPPTDEAPAIGAEVVELALRRKERRLVVIGSTDLTHYGPNYDFQAHGRGAVGHAWVRTKNDPEVVHAMEALDAAKVVWVARRSHNACCPGAAAAAIVGARKLGATRGVTVEQTTSFDVRPSGPEPTSFVGYASLVLA